MGQFRYPCILLTWGTIDSSDSYHLPENLLEIWHDEEISGALESKFFKTWIDG